MLYYAEAIRLSGAQVSLLTLPRPVCEYHKPDNLDYLDSHADAERRMKRGQKQIQCPDCKSWFWRHELGKKPRAK